MRVKIYTSVVNITLIQHNGQISHVTYVCAFPSAAKAEEWTTDLKHSYVLESGEFSTQLYKEMYSEIRFEYHKNHNYIHVETQVMKTFRAKVRMDSFAYANVEVEALDQDEAIHRVEKMMECGEINWDCSQDLDVDNETKIVGIYETI